MLRKKHLSSSQLLSKQFILAEYALLAKVRASLLQKVMTSDGRRKGGGGGAGSRGEMRFGGNRAGQLVPHSIRRGKGYRIEPKNQLYLGHGIALVVHE